MGVNKVIYGGETIVDMTDANATPEQILEGASAYGANGELIQGSLTVSPIDETLTKQGHAADAKAVGDEFTQVKSEFTEQKGQAIYATDLLAPYPVPTFVRWDRNTKNTPFTDGMVLNQDGFAFVQGDDYFHTIIAFTQGADNTRYWLNHTIDNGINRGWKNMTRELTEGTTLNDGWGMLNSFPYNTHILHRSNNKDFSSWTEFVVQYPNEHNGGNEKQLLMLNRVINNVAHWYKVYSELTVTARNFGVAAGTELMYEGDIIQVYE